MSALRPPSFKKVDYSLRPNKNIERKLIAEALQRLSPTFPVAEFRYVGLGGIWFVDFVLFHRVLRIQDMISIQRGKMDAERAVFNRPLRCVEVKEGESTVVLPRLPLSDKQILLWMDYDSTLAGPALGDIDIVCERLKSGSIALFTVNANHSQLRRFGEGGVVRERKDVLAELLGVSSTRVPDEATETEKFAAYVASQLFLRMKSGVRRSSGDSLKFVPIFNFAYEDQASMITVGGMVADAEHEARLYSTGIFDLDHVTGENQFLIAVPLLTHREKLAIDRLLPWDEAESTAALESPLRALEPAEIDAYRKFYRYYPTFAELVM